MLDEPRHDEFAASFNDCRLGYVSGGVTLCTGLALRHFQLYVNGWRNRNGHPVEQHHCASHSILEVLPRVVYLGRRQFMLLKTGAVHEYVAVRLFVEKLNINFFHISSFEFIAAFVSSVKHRIAYQVAHSALIERVSFARFNEGHFHHQIRFAIDLYLQTLFEIVCFIGTHFKSSCFKSNLLAAVRQFRLGLQPRVGLNVVPNGRRGSKWRRF